MAELGGRFLQRVCGVGESCRMAPERSQEEDGEWIQGNVGVIQEEAVGFSVGEELYR